MLTKSIKEEGAMKMSSCGNRRRRAREIMQKSASVVFAAIVLSSSATTLTSMQVNAFSGPLFQASTINRKLAPSQTQGVEVELPNFDELFRRIQLVSPLARQVIQNGRCGNDVDNNRHRRGFGYIDDAGGDKNLKWKKVEANKKKACHRIDKIENFQNLGSPIFRYRASLKGPCLAEPFADLIMTLDQRKKWDAQIARVDELYTITDLDAVNEIMMRGGGGDGDGGHFGECSRLGVGYCQTKSNLGITPREQMTICGIQDFDDGSALIWGTEMEEWHNHLLPPLPHRHTRAKTHLFCTTLTPTGEGTFDVEYVLQMDTGGNLPGWMTNPILVDTVKNLFRHAESYFGAGEGGEVHRYLMDKIRRSDAEKETSTSARVTTKGIQVSQDAEIGTVVQGPLAALSTSIPDELPSEATAVDETVRVATNLGRNDRAADAAAEESLVLPAIHRAEPSENADEILAPPQAQAEAARLDETAAAEKTSTHQKKNAAQELSSVVLPFQSPESSLEEIYIEASKRSKEIVDATSTVGRNIALMAESKAQSIFKSVVEKSLRRPIRRLSYLRRTMKVFVRRQLAFVR